jgi:hypothetical protein
MICFVNTALCAIRLPSGQSSMTGQSIPASHDQHSRRTGTLLGIMHSNAVSFAARWKFHFYVWLA